MKRLNPSTNLPFKRGDLRKDGYCFSQYTAIIKNNGFYMEQWLSPNSLANSRIYKKQHSKHEKSSKQGHIKQLLKNIKCRAKKAGVPFDLTFEYVYSLAPDTCPVFGFDLSWGVANTNIKPHSPSLDKIDPSLGYIVGNVQWLSLKANAMKQDATKDELKQFADWVMS